MTREELENRWPFARGGRAADVDCIGHRSTVLQTPCYAVFTTQNRYARSMVHATNVRQLGKRRPPPPPKKTNFAS